MGLQSAWDQFYKAVDALAAGDGDLQTRLGLGWNELKWLTASRRERTIPSDLLDDFIDVMANRKKKIRCEEAKDVAAKIVDLFARIAERKAVEEYKRHGE